MRGGKGTRWRLRGGPCSARSIHADQFAGQVCRILLRVVDSTGQRRKIWVEGADDDAGMRGAFDVKSDEMTAIQCDDGPPVACREIQDFFVRHRSAGVTTLAHRLDIMVQTSELDHDLFRQILIGVEPRHVRPLDARGSALRSRPREAARTPTR